MDRLESPRSKLDWAHEHLQTLDRKLRAFLAAHNYEAVREHDPQLGLDVMRMKIAGKPPLPKEFSHRIGEFATALRASLDHLVWALIVSAPKNPNKIQFPIFDSKTKYGSGWRPNLSGAVAGVEPIIKDLQPYHASESHTHPLWRIHRLSNTDKHRIIVLRPRAFRMSALAVPGQRLGVTATLADSLDEDPKIPIPPIPADWGFDFKVEPTFAVVLENADVDTGIFMGFDELPALYEYVRDKVFPPLEKLVPQP